MEIVWRTTDGRVFLHREEAEEHEAFKAIEATIKKILRKICYQGTYNNTQLYASVNILDLSILFFNATDEQRAALLGELTKLNAIKR